MREYTSTQHVEHLSSSQTMHFRVHTWHIPFSQIPHSQILRVIPWARKHIWHLVGGVGRPAEFGECKVGNATRWGEEKRVLGRDVVDNAGIIVAGVDRRRLVLSLVEKEGRRGFASILLILWIDDRWALGYCDGSCSWWSGIFKFQVGVIRSAFSFPYRSSRFRFFGVVNDDGDVAVTETMWWT